MALVKCFPGFLKPEGGRRLECRDSRTHCIRESTVGALITSNIRVPYFEYGYSFLDLK